MGVQRVLIGISLAACAVRAQADECFDLYQLSEYQHAVEPGIEIAATRNLPRDCVVRGVINHATIRFEVRLPMDDWNGRFLMLGAGGSSGYVADTTFGLGLGFAVSSTDTDHEGNDLAFATQPEAALD